MKKVVFSGLTAGAVLMLIAGCAGRPKPPVIGKEQIVEKSAKARPEWILTPAFEKKDILYFSGGVTGRANYSLALRQAKMEAVKNVTEGIQAKVRTEFTEAVRGSNISEADLGEFVSDAIGVITENLNIQGLKPTEIYHEKVERTTATGVEYSYNCYYLLEISEPDYMQARNIALEGLRDRAKAENNAKAEEIATDLLKKLSQ